MCRRPDASRASLRSFVRCFAAAAMLAASLGAMPSATAQSDRSPERYPGIGRAATPAEVAAWDIDVRADFKGLPKGSGSVAKGQEVWEAKCASCHGVFGESNEVFNPLVGGTTAKDIETGRVANLQRNDYPGRTTMMKLSNVATLWDYIHRAMPWNNPKSLTTEEVYATTAYMLNLAGVVPDNFVLSDTTIADAQKRLPNRNGKTTAHALWPGAPLPGATKKPDVQGTACMANCATEVKVTSMLPDFARHAHGNLAEQSRLVGPQRGIDTTRPVAAGEAPVAQAVVAAAPATATTSTKAAAASQGSSMPTDVLQKNACVACHAADRQLVGPSWDAISKKHAGKADYLAGKIRAGGSGVWGAIPMPPQTLSADDAKRVAEWLATRAAR